MLTKNKKIIIILLIIIVLGLGFTIIYYFLQRKPEISIEKKPISKLSDEKIMGVKFIKDNKKARFLSLNNYTLKELDIASNALTELSPIQMYQVLELVWSPNGQRLIIKVENDSTLFSQLGIFYDKAVPDGVTTNWSFDIATQTLTELPLEIGGVDWLNDDEIIYYYSKSLIDEEISSEQAGTGLYKANYFGKNYKKIIDLDNANFYNSGVHTSPNKNQVLLLPEIEGVGENYVYIFNLTNNVFEKISEDKRTGAASWSSSGNHIFLYQITEDGSMADLWYATDKGVDKKNLRLKTSYPLATTDFSGQNIFVISSDTDGQAVYQINSSNLDTKIIASSTIESDLANFSELGPAGNNIYVVANENLYLIKI